MVDKRTSSAVNSTHNSPTPQRVRTSSPKTEEDNLASPKQDAAVAAVATETIPEDGELEADFDNVSDSGFGTDNSDTTSIASSIYAGYVENGRRYQTLREGEYWGPSDEKQFEAMQAAHIVYLVLDSKQKNNLFRSPIPETAQNILDIGTGNGVWAVEVADRYSGAVVVGVDLFPPTDTWVPPNCRFEVDDVLKPWMFQNQFDLIHMRDMHGSFTDKQWTGVYSQAYKNLVPGGWIEQAEPGISFFSDDGSLPADSLLAKWGPLFIRCCASTGKPINTIDTFKSSIEAAGFTNIQEKLYKVPIGDWAKNPILKEAGKFSKAQLMAGIEGYAMYILTKFGEPAPWSPEEVQVYLAKVRNEIETGGFHAYAFKKRVWAQKPFETDAKVEDQVQVNDLA